MKERPILFGASMVRALLDGSKTQTRRIVKSRYEFEVLDAPGIGLWPHLMPYTDALEEEKMLCPYGQPGDRLWVRETWGVGSRPDPWGGYDGIEYRADEAWLEEGDDLPCHKVKTPEDVYLSDYRSGWKPSIHMPRWASRILLEVTGVRVERLRDISEADCYAEGIQIPCDTDGHPLICLTGKFPTSRYIENPRKVTSRDLARAEYASLWESINGAGSWDANPWVWVLEFRRLTP